MKFDGSKPTPAFIGASWSCLCIGIFGFIMGLWNADMLLNEKGYYFSVLLLGLYSAISLQKTVRDKEDGIPVTSLYYNISWFALIASVVLLFVGLRNADLLLSEKGFYGMAFTLSLFSAITVQKNVRDLAKLEVKKEKPKSIAVPKTDSDKATSLTKPNS